MKSFFLFIIIALCGCREKRPSFSEQAESALFTECTNSIVGLNRIIRYSIDYHDYQPSNWTAEVTAEFINPVGGITRTNVPFRFTATPDRTFVGCYVDDAKIYDERMRRIKGK